jgi:hypothetical protein
METSRPDFGPLIEEFGMRVSKYSHDQQSANGNSPLKFSGSLQNAKLIQIPF